MALETTAYACVYGEPARSLMGTTSGFNPWEGTLGEGFVLIAVYLPDGFAQLGSPVAAVSGRERQVARGFCLVLFRLACAGVTVGPPRPCRRGSLREPVTSCLGDLQGTAGQHGPNDLCSHAPLIPGCFSATRTGLQTRECLSITWAPRALLL